MVANFNTNDNDTTEKVDDVFVCKLCDFTSACENGLMVHTERRHKNEHFDDDLKYENTEHYWKEGWLGRVYQTYIEANEVLNEIEMDSRTKNLEKEKILDARKLAFGNNYKHFPPWSNDSFM